MKLEIRASFLWILLRAGVFLLILNSIPVLFMIFFEDSLGNKIYGYGVMVFIFFVVFVITMYQYKVPVLLYDQEKVTVHDLFFIGAPYEVEIKSLKSLTLDGTRLIIFSEEEKRVNLSLLPESSIQELEFFCKHWGGEVIPPKNNSSQS